MATCVVAAFSEEAGEAGIGITGAEGDGRVRLCGGRCGRSAHMRCETFEADGDTGFGWQLAARGIA